MPAKAQVLCVEDDPHIGQLVSLQLREMGHGVEWVADGMAGLERCMERAFDLVILDLMLPNLGGLDICRRMRAHNRLTPVVMLSAKADKRDVIRGLELGADDYITKPFSTAELAARVQALLRRVAADRSHHDIALQPFRCCDLLVDAERREVRRGATVLALTAKEFDLLLLFARNPGRVFSRGEILNRVWGAEFDGYEHTVNTHINRLRNKVEADAAQPAYIQTVWGVGYRFAQPGQGDDPRE